MVAHKEIKLKQKFVEKSPEGWEGTVKSMKDKSDVDNPWALAHWMKQKGYKSHKEAVAEDRDYKAEYKKFQSSDKAKKYRAELNQYNRKKGTYGNGDGKDASHKGGKIVGFEKESTNRGRAEKSRLKKESDFPTTTKKDKTVTVVHKTSGKELVIIDTPSTRKKYKRRDYFVQADPRKIKKAVRIAKKMSGDMTDAVKKIERIEKDLSNNHEVAYALKTANESINEINIPKFVKSTVRGRHKITKKGKGYVVQVHNPFDANKLVKFGNNKGLKIKAQHRFGASEAEYFISEGKLSESLPTKIKDLRKIKKVKTEPDSAKGTYNSTATFSQHHAGSMGAGDMGTISEPDTYDWDDSGSKPNQGGHQVKKDKKKKGYEPVREGKLTEASVWFNPKVLEPYLKKIGLKFPKYPKQGDVTKDGKKVGYMDNFNGFSVYSKSLLKQLQKVEKKYKLGIWNATSGLTMEGKLNEGFDKYYLSSLLDSKLKKKLEIAIKNLRGKVDGVGDDYIWFRMPSGNIRTLAQLIQRLDKNKNVWIGDKRKNNIWDRRRNIDKLGESINEGFNFRKTVSELDSEYEWHYVESEGSYAVRFDWKANDRIDPDRSMWINNNGSVEGQVPNDSRLKRKMKKLGVKVK